MDQKIQDKKISKIVITGGPCAGKTTAMSRIQDAFTKQGYMVLFVPETATELILGGLSPQSCRSNLHFQEYLLRLQMEKERVFMRAAQDSEKEKILIVCDRGVLDNKAYMGREEFGELLMRLGKNETEARDEYDAVFHLVTAAKGAEEFYSLENNAARRESVREAAEADNRLIAAWTGHPHLRVIDNSSDFEKKMFRLISEISSFLGEPHPYEIERKYLICYPDIAMLEGMENCRKVQIMQTYLKSANDEEVRIRQRGLDGNYTYYKTRKKNINGIRRMETEERLSKEQYLRQLMDADPGRAPIQKDRYCLIYDNQYFEIDVYPFWTHQAILEIELSNEGEEPRFPDFLKIIREVSGESRYKNYSLALNRGYGL